MQMELKSLQSRELDVKIGGEEKLHGEICLFWLGWVFHQFSLNLSADKDLSHQYNNLAVLT